MSAVKAARSQRGELDRHYGAATIRCGRADHAAMRFDDRASDRQTKARPLPAPRGIGSVEPFEDPLLAPLWQPWPGVAHLEKDAVISFRDRDADRGTAVAEGVVEK